MIKVDKTAARFMALAALSIVLMLISNILASKIILIAGITMTPGIFIYPFSFMLGDVITELYGFKNMKKVLYLGFIIQVLFVALSQLTLAAPYPVFWTGQEAFNTIFSTTPQIVLGSLAAFLLGGLVNSKIMDIMKRGKHLWQRTIVSTLFGEAIDSIVFVFIAFIGRMPMSALLTMIVVQIVVKTLIEAFAGTPMAYAVIKRIKKDSIKEQPKVKR